MAIAGIHIADTGAKSTSGSQALALTATVDEGPICYLNYFQDVGLLMSASTSVDCRDEYSRALSESCGGGIITIWISRVGICDCAFFSSGGDSVAQKSAGDPSGEGSAFEEGRQSQTGPNCIKLWRVDLRGHGLELLQTVDVFGSMADASTKFDEVPISRVCALPDISQVAVGLVNGAVILLRGALLKGGKAVRRTLMQPQGDFAVAGMGFGTSQDPDTGENHVALFVATEERLIAYPNCHIASEANKMLKRGIVHGNGSCISGCFTVSQDGEAAVANDDGVFFFRRQDRGPCYAFTGTKSGFYPSGRVVLLFFQSKEGKIAFQCII